MDNSVKENCTGGSEPLQENSTSEGGGGGTESDGGNNLVKEISTGGSQPLQEKSTSEVVVAQKVMLRRTNTLGVKVQMKVQFQTVNHQKKSKRRKI